MNPLLLTSAPFTIGGCFIIIAGYPIGFGLVAVGVGIELWVALK